MIRSTTTNESVGLLSRPLRTGVLQRKCACGQHTIAGAECEACGKERLQRRATDQAEIAEAPPIVHDVLRSTGQPLETQTRTFMESRFNHDFSRVRVHTDPKAFEAAQAMSAQAFTVGQEIVFARNRYSPQSRSGRELLAHELAHVVQQRGSALARMPIKVGEPRDEFEREADRVASDVLYPLTGLRDSAETYLQRKIAPPEAGKQGKSKAVESNFIRCLRALMEKSQWRYDEIKSKHRNLDFSLKTYTSINNSLHTYLSQDISVACERDNNYFCCGTISSVKVSEAPPGTRKEQSYKPNYGSGSDDEIGMGEQEVKVKGGSYFIDIEVDMSLEEKDCCPPEPPMIVT